MKDLIFKLEANIADQQEIGLGSIYLVEGYCFHLTQKIKELALELGNHRFEIRNRSDTREGVYKQYHQVDKRGNALRSGFWQLIKLDSDLIGQTLGQWLVVTFANGEKHREYIGQKSFIQDRLDPLRVDVSKIQASQTDNPKIAICLATYEPEITQFQRQIESIINQDYQNWVCIVCDDNSTLVKTKAIAEICAKDPRIFCINSKTNKGFYYNFEECLRHIPEHSQYIAFSDQDDFWYPDKLESLVNAFDRETMLVYSDMRIVNEDGSELANTYWQNRKNNYSDLGKLLLANTVTGAAMMFRSELIQKILPFPRKIGDAFHDHWIACLALSVGKIKYINRPLYDYYQYGNSVIGFCDFGGENPSKKLKGLFSIIREHCSIGKVKLLLMKTRNSSLAIFRFECRRLMLTVKTIKLRCDIDDRSKYKALNLFDSPFSILKLLLIHVKITLDKYTTDDAELRLASGYAVNFIDRPIIKIFKKRIISRSNFPLEG